MLDTELKLHVSAMNENFDYEKLTFYLEAKGEFQQEEVQKAQSKIQSAFQASLIAAHKLFMTNLEHDQLEHRRRVASLSGDAERNRTAVLSNLQAGCVKCVICF